MQSFFEPNYSVLTFLFFKKFVFFQILLLLSLFRIFTSQAKARLVSFLVFLLASWALITLFAPSLGWYGLPLGRQTALLLGLQNGMLAPVGLSLIFAATRPSAAESGWNTGTSPRTSCDARISVA